MQQASWISSSRIGVCAVTESIGLLASLPPYSSGLVSTELVFATAWGLVPQSLGPSRLSKADRIEHNIRVFPNRFACTGGISMEANWKSPSLWIVGQGM